MKSTIISMLALVAVNCASLALAEGLSASDPNFLWRSFHKWGSLRLLNVALGVAF